MFTNDTGMWTQWLDFHASSVVAAREHGLFTGDTGLLSQLWASNDGAIRVRRLGGCEALGSVHAALCPSRTTMCSSPSSSG